MKHPRQILIKPNSGRSTSGGQNKFTTNQSPQSHRAASLDRRIKQAEQQKKYLVRADYATKNEKPPELNRHISARQSLIDQRIARLKRERSKFPTDPCEQKSR